MALSEEELRLLQQMEAALAEEDPKLANTLRGTTVRRVHRRRAALAGVGFLVGIAALIAGMETHPVVSILGFVIMLVSTIVALSSWRRVDVGARLGDRRSEPTPGGSTPVDDPWRHRHDDGI